MKFKVKSKVTMYGVTFTHSHEQEFSDDGNVFGRALEYHQYMQKTFPNATDFELIKAEEQKEDKAMTKLEKILQKERARLVAARDKEKAARGNRTDRHKELTKQIHAIDREIKIAQKCKYAC